MFDRPHKKVYQAHKNFSAQIFENWFLTNNFNGTSWLSWIIGTTYGSMNSFPLFTTYEYYIFFQKISVNLILFKKTVKSFIKLVVQVINNFECADQLHCGNMRWLQRARGRTRPLPPPRQMGRLWLQLVMSWRTCCDTCKTFVLDRPETWRFTNDDSQPERKRKGFLNDCL